MHATLAFSALPLLLGAALSDWAYGVSYQVQWTNFASWLIAGGLVLVGIALIWAAAALVRAGVGHDRRVMLYLALLLASVVLGLLNAFVHARDAWAAMPAGLVLSVIVLVLAALAAGLGLAGARRSGAA